MATRAGGGQWPGLIGAGRLGVGVVKGCRGSREAEKGWGSGVGGCTGGGHNTWTKPIAFQYYHVVVCSLLFSLEKYVSLL